MIVKLPGMEYTPSPGDMAHEFWESDAERKSEILYYLADIYENDLFAWCKQMAYAGNELSEDQRKKVVSMLKEMVNQIAG